MPILYLKLKLNLYGLVGFHRNSTYYFSQSSRNHFEPVSGESGAAYLRNYNSINNQQRYGIILSLMIPDMDNFLSGLPEAISHKPKMNYSSTNRVVVPNVMPRHYHQEVRTKILNFQ